MSNNRKRNSRTTTITRFLACLCFVFVLSDRGFAVSYSCGNPSTGHCYGRTRWQEKPEYFGAYTDVNQVSLACPKGCSGFINDEIWLIDSRSPGCVGNKFGQCWVEAGSIDVDGDNPVFFWADSRPNNTSTFNLHLLA